MWVGKPITTQAGRKLRRGFRRSSNGRASSGKAKQKTPYSLSDQRGTHRVCRQSRFKALLFGTAPPQGSITPAAEPTATDPQLPLKRCAQSKLGGEIASLPHSGLFCAGFARWVHREFTSRQSKEPSWSRETGFEGLCEGFVRWCAVVWKAERSLGGENTFVGLVAGVCVEVL